MGKEEESRPGFLKDYLDLLAGRTGMLMASGAHGRGTHAH